MQYFVRCEVLVRCRTTHVHVNLLLRFITSPVLWAASPFPELERQPFSPTSDRARVARAEYVRVFVVLFRLSASPAHILVQGQATTASVLHYFRKYGRRTGKLLALVVLFLGLRCQQPNR